MLLFLFLSWAIQLSGDAITDGGTPNPAYGFTWGGFVYLNQFETLTKYDFEGNVVAGFSRKGQGPGEISAGGPMFRKDGEIWVFDVGSGRILIFDPDLKYLREFKSSDLTSPGRAGFCVVNDYIYLARSNSEIMGIERFSFVRENSLQKIPSPWLQTDFKSPNLRLLYFDQQHFSIFEGVQNREYFRAWLYSLDERRPIPLEIFNPGYDLQETNNSNQRYFHAMKQGMAHIAGIVKNGDRAWCFLQAFKRDAAGGYEWFHYWRVDVNLNTGKTVEVVPMPGRLIYFYGPTEHALIMDEAENVVLLPLNPGESGPR